jgi:hypothetical protein
MRAAGSRRLVASATVAFVCATASTAGAQIRWDVGAEVGAMKRFTTAKAEGAPNLEVGPAFQLDGHVALVPMVRVGGYLAQDVAPADGVGARTFWGGGLHVKVTPPLLSAPWRFWVSAGFGYAYSHAASYHGQVATRGGGSDLDVVFGSTHGGLLEVPLGLDLGYRASGRFLFFAELGGRPVLASYGPMYAGGQRATGVTTAAPFMGKDSFAASLSVGLSLQE